MRFKTRVPTLTGLVVFLTTNPGSQQITNKEPMRAELVNRRATGSEE
jgi:hypothetical protein